MDRFTSMAVFKRAVETRLGVRPLNRTTRRLHLTEVGRNSIKHMTSITTGLKVGSGNGTKQRDRTYKAPAVAAALRSQLHARKTLPASEE